MCEALAFVCKMLSCVLDCHCTSRNSRAPSARQTSASKETWRFFRSTRTCPTRTTPELARNAGPYVEPSMHDLMVAADATPFHEDGSLRTRVEELAAYAELRGHRGDQLELAIDYLEGRKHLPVIGLRRAA